MKIILVDDEQKFIKMLAKRLAFRGIQADIVFTGDDAVKQVAQTRYDVAVLDIKMPGISGVELKEKLSLLDPRLKFIFVTGHGAAAAPEKEPAKAEIYLSKPLDLDLLITMIGKVTQA